MPVSYDTRPVQPESGMQAREVCGQETLMQGACCLQLEDLKRQQSDKVERLREAEAAVRTLQTQIQGAEEAKQQLQAQLQRNGALDRCGTGSLPPSSSQLLKWPVVSGL